jgi:hypothetical protein
MCKQGERGKGKGERGNLGGGCEFDEEYNDWGIGFIEVRRDSQK